MNKILIISLILTSLFSGCISDNKGTTYSYSDGSNFTLFDDGTAYIYIASLNVGYSGTYRINNSELYLIFPTGITERLSRDGTAWVDNDGWRWEPGLLQ